MAPRRRDRRPDEDDGASTSQLRRASSWDRMNYTLSPRSKARVTPQHVVGGQGNGSDHDTERGEAAHGVSTAGPVPTKNTQRGKQARAQPRVRCSPKPPGDAEDDEPEHDEQVANTYVSGMLPGAAASRSDRLTPSFLQPRLSTDSVSRVNE